MKPDFSSGREYLECDCHNNKFISDIDLKTLKLRFSVVVDHETNTRRINYCELIVTPQGEAECMMCGRKIDIEGEFENIVVSV